MDLVGSESVPEPQDGPRTRAFLLVNGGQLRRCSDAEIMPLMNLGRNLRSLSTSQLITNRLRANFPLRLTFYA